MFDIKIDKSFPRILEIVKILEEDPSEADVSNFSDWISVWNDIDFIIATYKNKIIGFAILVNDEQAPLLDVLYVLPRWRNKKVGSKLILKCKELYSRITLIANNENSIRFYERNDFKKSGTIYHALGYGEHATALNYGEQK